MPDAEGHPDRSEMDLLTILNALSDPLRYQVIRTFASLPKGTERTCLSFGFPVSKSTLSHHFKTLRESGLVQQVDRGNSRKAHLRREDLEARFPGLLELVVQNPVAPARTEREASSTVTATSPSRSR
ncbi:ArsR/SmtB family transcription factor [Streptomyces sp. NPDC091387]|uniref:ArsR/SmtB family transcription factor n=1 Tax=Streptomyces sp. NPDC091387 TaxID=3365998 RepID=UPI0038237C4F